MDGTTPSKSLGVALQTRALILNDNRVQSLWKERSGGRENDQGRAGLGWNEDESVHVCREKRVWWAKTPCADSNCFCFFLPCVLPSDRRRKPQGQTQIKGDGWGWEGDQHCSPRAEWCLQSINQSYNLYIVILGQFLVMTHGLYSWPVVYSNIHHHHHKITLSVQTSLHFLEIVHF